jgi:hypothetical protein
MPGFFPNPVAFEQKWEQARQIEWLPGRIPDSNL